MLIENAPIRLLPLESSHKDYFQALANIPDINRRINKPFPYLESHFGELLKKPQAGILHTWIIESAGVNTGVINTASLRHPKIFQGGYWLHPDHWGNNIAACALAAVRNFLWEHHHAERIQAVVEPDNTASIRVLEKCGYQREGLLRKFYPTLTRDLIDVYMYACVRN